MRKSDQSSETYRRIIEATQGLLADQGYEATGVAEICRAADVSKGAFYYHFPSKQAVLQAILDEWMHALDPGPDLWQDDTRPAPDVLREVGQTAAEIFRGDQRTARLFLEFWSLAGRDPSVAEAARAPYRRYAAGLAQVVRRGREEGSLAKVEPEPAGRVLVSLAVGVLLSSLLDPGAADWGEVLTSGLGSLLRGMRTEA